MNRRDFLKLSAAGSACIGFSGVPALKTIAAEQFRLKYDSYISGGALPSALSQWFFDQLQSRSGGRIDVQYYWGQSLSKAGQSLHAVSKGMSELSLISPGYYQSALPVTRGLEWYYRVQHPDALMKICRDLYQQFPPLKDEWESRHNAKVLYWTNWYHCPLITKHPIAGIEDLKGKRIRAYGATAQVMKDLGAHPIPMPASEVYTSLERGVLDGTIGFEFVTSINYGLHEPAPYYTEIGLGANAPTPVIMNMDTWLSLPEDLKAIAEELAEELYQHQYLEIYNRTAKQSVKQAIAEGVNFSKWSDETISEARERVQPKQVQEWVDNVAAKHGIDGAGMQRLIEESIKRYDPKGQLPSPYDIYQQLS